LFPHSILQLLGRTKVFVLASLEQSFVSTVTV
jgi:hypothetical protein